MELVKQAQLRVGVYWHIFPTYSEGKDAVWRDKTMLFSLIPKKLIEKTNDSDLIIYFKNGSIYQVKGSDDYSKLRGAGPVGVILDEFATMKFETWHEIVEPILRANGGWCWFIGTPKGKNHLFELYQRGLTGDNEWKSWLVKATESKIISADQLEKSRRTSLEATWNQEYLCEFLEGEGSVFRSVKAAATAVPIPPIQNHIYTMGVDLAKVQDYTVVSVFDRINNHQVYQDRFNIIEWPFQKKRIKEICLHYNRALITIDGTGLGDPVVDDLVREGLPVEPVKITEETKKELVEKLSIWLEQKKMSIIPMSETFFEYDNFSYEIGPTGKIRYGARVGFHDDIVISHALGIWNLQPIYREEVKKELNPIQQAMKDRMKSSYENDSDIDYEIAE